jgi:hypothetical protein
MLVMSRKAQETYPLRESDFITPGGGQVQGLSVQQVQRILAEHGIHKQLSREGGRTSRGTVGFVRSYADFLNQLNEGPLSGKPESTRKDALEAIEARVIDFVREHFGTQRLTVALSPDLAPSAIVSAILETARERQKETGSATEGAVAQHLVGAKLALRFPEVDISNHPYTAGDKQTDRLGDFELQDAVFHVTINPSEAVLQRCLENFNSGKRPVLLIAASKLPGAVVIAEQMDMKNRVDIYDIERFVSANLSEIAGFSSENLKGAFQRLIEIYNDRVDEAETDHSLKIEL